MSAGLCYESVPFCNQPCETSLHCCKTQKCTPETIDIMNAHPNTPRLFEWSVTKCPDISAT